MNMRGNVQGVQKTCMPSRANGASRRRHHLLKRQSLQNSLVCKGTTEGPPILHQMLRPHGKIRVFFTLTLSPQQLHWADKVLWFVSTLSAVSLHALKCTLRVRVYEYEYFWECDHPILLLLMCMMCMMSRVVHVKHTNTYSHPCESQQPQKTRTQF